MKTNLREQNGAAFAAQRVLRKGKRMVMLDEAAYESLLRKADLWEPDLPALMSGEDLCNVGPVALLQDLAVNAVLGISSVERNGHHYNAGLSQFPEVVQQQMLKSHGDLYRRSEAGWPTLNIRNGATQLGSVNESPFGVRFLLDVGKFTPAKDWQPQVAR